MKTNYRKINKVNKQIQVKCSHENLIESTINPIKIIPRRTVHVLNKMTIQNLAIRDRTHATTEWVKNQRNMEKFENHDRVKYPEPSIPMDNDDKASLYSYSDECTSYTVLLVFLALTCLLKNI